MLILICKRREGEEGIGEVYMVEEWFCETTVGLDQFIVAVQKVSKRVMSHVIEQPHNTISQFTPLPT